VTGPRADGTRRTVTHSSLTAALVILVALTAAAPLWGPGIINTRGGGDSPFLIQRTMDLAENFRHGIFPPRWMSHAAYDLGYPFFNHYAALPYYLSAGLTAAGTNALTAIQATQTLGFLLAALAMYGWSGQVLRSRAARLVAVAAYTFAPFHMVNVYVRGDSLSEFYAFVWYPLILWALDRGVRRPTLARVTVSAAAYGALILTHNVSAVLFSPFALLYGLLRVFRLAPPTSTGSLWTRARQVALHAPTLRRTAAVASSFLIGIILTAWFWLPAVAETTYGQLGPEFTEGYFHYSNHFRGAGLVQPSAAFNYSIATTVEAAGPFSMGLIQAGLAAAGASVLIAAALRKDCLADRRVPNLGLALMLAIATLMITPLSVPLWDTIPLLAITQFPWRFLSVQALFTAIVSGALGEHTLWTETAGSASGRVRSAIAVLTAAISITLIAAGAMINLSPERLVIGPEDLGWETLRRYESFTGNIGTTIRYEYLPADVVPRLYTSEAVIDGVGRPIADGGEVTAAELIWRTPVRQRWRVTLAGDGAPVAFPVNWWPGWQATVDGRRVETAPMPGSGRLTVTLPGGHHEVTLRLGSTPLRSAAAGVSLGCLAALVVGLALNPARRAAWPSWARRFGCGAVLLVLSFIGPLALQRPPEGDAVFFDFQSMPYPHQGPVIVADGVLSTVETSPNAAGPGDVVTIELVWEQRPSEPVTVTAQLVSPALPRHGVDYVLAEVSAPVTTGAPMRMVLPDDVARGELLVRLLLRDRRGTVAATTLSGETMGDLYVGHMDVPTGPSLRPDAPVLRAYRDLVLHTVEAHQPSSGVLAAKMTWSTSGTPRNWRLSLRLLDAMGRLVVQQDHQPGYGYLPTTMWHAGELVADRAYLPLPEGLAPGDYTLQVITYLQATGDGGGEHAVPVSLDSPTLYDLRDACCEQTRKGASITEGDDVTIEGEWNALLAPGTSFDTRWVLVAGDGAVVAEAEGPLAPGSDTARWPRFTWVLSSVPMNLPSRLPAGTYGVQLEMVDEDGRVVQCGEVSAIEVKPRPRRFEAPDPDHVQRAAFAGTISLLGYDLTQDGERLHLTLWWRAERTSSQDLKRFVHLVDPETQAIVAQDDAMPRNWTYPTTWWLPGEVVSETVSLGLADVRPGSYRLAVGWYDPATMDRLPVTTAPEGATVDRVSLHDVVTVR